MLQYLIVAAAVCASSLAQAQVQTTSPLSAPGPTIHTQHPLLTRAVSAPQKGPNYAFHMRYEDDDVRAEAFVNPSKPRGERVSVISPAPSEWDKDFKEMLSEFDAAPYEEFWCADFLKFIGHDIHLVQEDQHSAVFAFSPQPGLDDDADDRKFLSEMIAHLTLDRWSGTIKKFEMRNRRPFKPIFIAKIKSFQMEAHCEVSPDGRPYIAQIETSLSGKIALKKIRQHERRVISNLTLP